MPKLTLCITSPAELSLSQNQVLVQKEDGVSTLRPIEDIRIIIVDHHSARLTVPLINKLAEENVSVVFCNEAHIPITMTMDLSSNCQQTKYFRGQLEASAPKKKQVWKQIVEAKIVNQSLLLTKLHKGDDLLKPYYSKVRSGDVTNREGLAAKLYWRKLFGEDFIRDRNAPPPNNPLNYGYAILRSYMARAVMDAGLLPSIGLHHKSYYNAFPLVDDLMEPYRPYVDEKVYALQHDGVKRLDQKTKKSLIEMFYESPTYNTLCETAHSMSRIFAGVSNYIQYPKIS